MKATDAERISTIRAQLEKEPLVNLHRWPISLSFDHGDLVIDGEVESVAAKKRALEISAAAPGIKGILDRLHVEPSQRMPDGEVRDRVLKVLSEESALQLCTLRAERDGRVEVVRPGAPETRGQIDVSVVEGVITLDGDVPSLTHKRLAESVVWWMPGTRDVVNGLGVTPPEEDSDDEITDALSMVFEKDPLLKGFKIGVRTDNRVVTLTGTLQTDEQRRAAEADGWCLFGVDRVVNQLQLRPPT